MSPIYTRRGDSGETDALGGGRIRKDHPRVHACGTIDELNAALGMARALGLPDPIDEALARVQNELFALGSDIAAPLDTSPSWLERLTDEAAARLESEIDGWEGELPRQEGFIVPGGTPGLATLHLARTIARRAERWAVALDAEESINPAALRYINRLSDWLFVAVRYAQAKTL
jgi:cob(I)alamin adenosyltransferase